LTFHHFVLISRISNEVNTMLYYRDENRNEWHLLEGIATDKEIEDWALARILDKANGEDTWRYIEFDNNGERKFIAAVYTDDGWGSGFDINYFIVGSAEVIYKELGLRVASCQFSPGHDYLKI